MSVPDLKLEEKNDKRNRLKKEKPYVYKTVNSRDEKSKRSQTRSFSLKLRPVAYNKRKNFAKTSKKGCCHQLGDFYPE